MLHQSQSVANRVLTFLSLAFILLLSFSVVLYPSENTHVTSRIAYRRDVPIGNPLKNPSDTPTSTPSTTNAPTTTTTSSAQLTSSTTSTTTTTSSTTTPPQSSSTTTTSTTPSSTASNSSSSTTSSTPTSIKVSTLSEPKPTATDIGSIVPSTYVPPTGTYTPPLIAPASTSSAAGSSAGFLATKSGRTATFTILGIILAALIGLAVAMVIRRHNRRQRRQLEDISFYEEKGPEDVPGTAALAPDTPSVYDHEPEMSEAMQPVDAAGAYPDRAMHYGNNDFSYPPAAATGYNTNNAGYQYDDGYNQQHAVTDHTAYAAYDYHAGQGQQQQQHQYDHGMLAPPVAFREPGARGGSTDQSIDSFYGGVTDPTHSHHVGSY